MLCRDSVVDVFIRQRYGSGESLSIAVSVEGKLVRRCLSVDVESIWIAEGSYERFVWKEYRRKSFDILI